MDNLKKSTIGALLLLLLASPLTFAAVAVDDFYVMDAERDDLIFFPSVEDNDDFGAGFTDLTLDDFECLRGGTIREIDGPGFVPDSGFVGTAECRYTITDDAGADQGTIFIDVQSNPSDFQAVEDNFYIPENGGTANPEFLSVRSNDRINFGSNSPAQLSGTSGMSTQGGTVAINVDGGVDYTPPSDDFTGKDTFTYTLSNDFDSSTATVTVYVGVEPGPNLAMPGNLTPEEARTFAVVIEACEQNDSSLPCNDIADLTPEEQKRFAQQVSGRHARLQARTMKLLQKQQSSNINLRLREIRTERNQISVDGLNLAVMGESLPLGPALQGSLRGGSAGDGKLISPWGAFINGKLSVGESKETATQTGYDQDGYNVTLGVDYRVSDTVVLGAAAGLGESETDFSSMQGRQNAQSLSLISFGNYYPADNLYIDGLAMWTQGDLDVKRNINVANIQQRLASDTTSRQLTAATSVGYEFNHQRWQSALYGRLEYSDLKVDGYTETGGNLALKVGEQDTYSFTSSLGSRVGYAFSWSKGVIVPTIELEYIKENSDDYNIRNQFAGAASAGQFSINSDEPDTEYMSLGTSASAVFSGGRSAFIRYETLLLQDSYDFSSYSVGFRTEF